MRIRLLPIAAGNSRVLSESLLRVKKGKLFVGRLRGLLLRGGTSVTMRSLGSVATMVPSKLGLTTIATERSPQSTFMSLGCNDLGRLPGKTIMKASDLHQRTRLLRL